MKKQNLVFAIIILVILIVIGVCFYNYTQNPNKEGSYSFIRRVAIINEKPAFEATNFLRKDFIVYDGKEYGKEYYKTYKPQEINGKLVFSAYNTKNGIATRYIINGNEVISDTNSYYDVSYPVEVNGKLAFEAYINGTKEKDDGKSIIIYDGKEYGNEYDWASEIVDVNGKLCYLARQIKNNKDFVVCDGKEYGKEYDSVENPISVNGKLAYIAIKNKKEFLVLDGKIASDEYDRIPRGYRDQVINIVNGKPAFGAVKGNETFVVYDGKEYKEGSYSPNSKKPMFEEDKGDVHFQISEVNGKLAYSYSKSIMTEPNRFEGINGYVIYDGKEYGNEYDFAQTPIDMNGKLGYIAKKDNKMFIVVDEKIVTQEYDGVSFVTMLNNKLVYVAKEGLKYSIHIE
jgi:hypothetical protein